MKILTINLLAAFFMLTIGVAETKAQVSVSVGVGLWSPPPEYASVNYYYLPDVDGYYYVPTHQYVYREGPSWVFRSSLPPRYAGYDIRTGYKVAVNRPRAYRYYDHDRASYGHFRGSHGGTIVRDHYHTNVINRTHYRTRVVNHTRVVNKPSHSNYHGHGSVQHGGQSHHAPSHGGGHGSPGHGGSHGSPSHGGGHSSPSHGGSHGGGHGHH